MEALRVFTEHVIERALGRCCAGPTEQELKATTVLALPLEESKRQGPHRRAELTMKRITRLPVWAGVPAARDRREKSLWPECTNGKKTNRSPLT